MRTRAIRWSEFFLVLTLLAWMAGCQKRPPRPPVATGPPAPLDGLRQLEREQAEQLIRADPAVQKLLGTGRSRLVYIDVIAVKPDSPENSRDPGALPRTRYAEAVFYRFDGDTGIRAVADLTNKRVIESGEVESNTVPLNNEDLTEALALAIQNQQMAALLGPAAQSFRVADPAAAGKEPVNVVRGLRVNSFDQSDPCYRHRCVQLFFQTNRGYLIDSAVVDLSTRRVDVVKGSMEGAPHENH